MIQFKRGKVGNLVTNADMILKSGQPFFDLTRKKLRIGDGETPLSRLKDVGGLSSEEILTAEDEVETNLATIFDGISDTAKDDLKAALGLDTSSGVLFTYGDKIPEKTYDGNKFIPSGQVYLQQYKGAVEQDYVIGCGKDASCYWRKWNSGFMECWGEGAFDDNNQAIKHIKSMFESTIYVNNNTTGNCFEVKGFCKE